MKKSIKVVICSIVTAALLLLGGCSNQIIQSGGISGDRKTSTGQGEYTLDKWNSSKVLIDNQTGNIEVNKTDDTKIKVRIIKKAQGGDQKELDEILNEVSVKMEESLGKLKISAVTQDGKKDFWEWKKQHHRFVNVSIDFHIDLPKDFSNYEIVNTTGEIKVNNLKGNFDVRNTTGNINLYNVTAVGNSEIQLTTGNITVDTSIDNIKMLNVRNTTGNITIMVPSDSKFTFDASVTTGIIGVNYDGKITRNDSSNRKVIREFDGGGKDIKVRLTTGNINLNKK